MPPDNDVQKEIEQLEQRYAENSQGLVFAHLADAYRRAGEYTKAEGLVIHGLKFHPSYTTAYNVLGRVYVDSERYSDAHEQFSKVLELDPHNMIAMRALGDLAVRGGRLEDARSWFERMLQIDPRNEGAREELGKLESGEVSPAAAPEPAAPDEVAAPEAAAAPAAGEAPWEPSSLLEGEEEVGPGEPLAEAEVADTPSAAWEGLGDLESLETTPAETLEEPLPVEGLEGFGGSEAPLTGEPLAEALSGDEGPEIDFGELDDWTPGLLREEDVEGQAADDLGVAGLREEFGGADEPESVLEALGDEGLGGEPEAVSPVSEGMVTETMAELYVDQGLYEDALAVYRELAKARPEDESVQARIAELEQRLAEAPAEPEAGVDLAELLELTDVALPETLEPPDVLAPLDDLAPPEAPTAPEAPSMPERPPTFEEVLAADVTEPPPGVIETPDVGIPEADTAPADTPVAPAEAPPAAGFEFEDEAPVAGIEHLDPFAASFDVMAERYEAAPMPGGIGDLVAEAEPARPTEPAPEPILEPAAEPVPGLLPETVPEAPEPELEIVPTIEEAPQEVEAASAADVLPPGADLGPSPVAPAAAEAPMPAAEAPAWEAPAAEPLEAPTIEEYLSGLLAFDPEQRAAAPESDAAGSPAVSPEPVDAPPPSEPAEASSAPEPSDDSSADDLEQFQEWLRSLKE